MISNGKTGTYAVIGLGTFGATVAKNLSRFGNHVIGIDISDRRVSAIVEDIGQGLIIDAREDGALREAGIEDVDAALVAMGSDIEASLLSVINLKTIGVKTIWAKATTKNHHRILSKLGVERVIHPEKEVGEQVAQMMHNPHVRDFMRIGTGQFVVNFRVPENLHGKKLKDVWKLKEYDLRCIGVLRGTDFLSHDGDGSVLEEDDLILLLGNRGDLRAFASSI
jgi:trk system potassium uptake protein TrkA